MEEEYMLLEKDFDFNNAVFTYFISNKSNSIFELHKNIFKDNLVISYTKNTSVYYYNNDLEAICIIGLCIDSYGKIERKNIPQYLIENSKSEIQFLFYNTRRLAGKYVIIYENKNGFFIFGDATCLLSIYYTTKNTICFSSCDELIRKYLNYKISKEHLEIKNGSPYYEALPYDITIYEDIKVVLPNHYLEINTKKISRFFPQYNNTLKVAKNQYNQIIENCEHLIDNIVKEYIKYYDIICPLTCGNDSRLNLVFLKRHIKNLNCFTLKHPNFTENTGDYYIPPQICATENVQHTIIQDLKSPKKYIKNINEIIGDYHSEYTIDLAYTINTMLPNKAIVTGDIIDQIGRGKYGKIPLLLANARNFNDFHNNKSLLFQEYLKQYIKNVKKDGCFSKIQDLFAIEYRCGRWVAQGSMIYAIAGISSLNIYNCREVIENFMSIAIKERINKIIHNRIFSNYSPQLLSIPINPDIKNKHNWLKSTFLFILVKPLLKYIIKYLKNMIKLQ